MHGTERRWRRQDPMAAEPCPAEHMNRCAGRDGGIGRIRKAASTFRSDALAIELPMRKIRSTIRNDWIEDRENGMLPVGCSEDFGRLCHSVVRSGRFGFCGRLSGAAVHAHRTLGSRWRNRRNRPHHRFASREGTRPAHQCRQPHGRQRRRGPRGDRPGQSGRLHHRARDGRDRDAALAGTDRAQLQGLHAPRTHEPRVRPAFR